MVPFEAQYCSLHSLVKEDCSTLGHFEYYRDDNAFAKEVGFSSRIMGTSHNKIVIPTGAQRSGGTCCGFFPGSHAHSISRGNSPAERIRHEQITENTVGHLGERFGVLAPTKVQLQAVGRHALISSPRNRAFQHGDEVIGITLRSDQGPLAAPLLILSTPALHPRNNWIHASPPTFAADSWPNFSG